jgi:hypothetical protein
VTAATPTKATAGQAARTNDRQVRHLMVVRADLLIGVPSTRRESPAQRLHPSVRAGTGSGTFGSRPKRGSMASLTHQDRGAATLACGPAFH